MSTYGNSREAFTDDEGNPIQGGKLYIGEPDQDPVANPKSITDLDDNAISNPVTLDDVGVPSIAFKVSGDFSQAVYDSDNVEVTSYQIARTAGFLSEGDISSITTQGSAWLSSRTYSKPDSVYGSDLNYYLSLTNSNLGNDPTVSPTAWSRDARPTIYNVNEDYDIDDACIGSDGRTYLSIVDNNTGNDPVTDGGVNWTNPNIAPAILTLESSGAWNKPSNLNYIKIIIVGGGGGAASSGSGETGGSGHSGGACIDIVNEPDLPATVNYIVGAGGAGTTSTSTGQGGDGGNTEFDIGSKIITATGGGGGYAPNSALMASPGVGSNGSININGSYGTSQDGADSVGYSLGGPGYFGGGSNLLALDAVGYGSGGAGTQGASGVAGGDGFDGVIVIEEYYK